jgi:hypothetical protein
MRKSFIHSFSISFIQSFHSFFHSFIHSFIHWSQLPSFFAFIPDRFFFEYLLLRNHRNSGNKKKQKKGSKENSTKVGISTLEQYKAALIDQYNLWAQYDPDKMKHVKKPNCDGLIKQAIATFRKQAFARNDAAGKGHGRGALHTNQISPDQVQQMAKLVVGGMVKAGKVDWERVRFVFLCCFKLGCRHDTLSQYKLADFDVKILENESSIQTVVALTLTAMKSKTNQIGTIKQTGIMRSINVWQCAVGAIAQDVFMRFHGKYNGINLIDFGSSEWKKHYLLPGKSSKEKAVYTTDSNNAFTAYQSLQDPIDTCSVTHLGRHVLSRLFSDMSVTDSDAKKFMEWAEIDTRNQFYTEPLVLPAMRVSAGSSKKEGRYHLKRDVVAPSRALIEATYPILPQLKLKVQQVVGGAQADATLEGFIDALEHLASTLLQDVAVMFDELKDQPILALSPFNTRAFLTFKAGLQAKMLAEKDDEIRMTIEDLEEQRQGQVADAIARASNALIERFGTARVRREATVATSSTSTSSSSSSSSSNIYRFSPGTRRLLENVSNLHEQSNLNTQLSNESNHPQNPATTNLLFNHKDSSTWSTTVIADDARATQFLDLVTPQDAADEWLRGDPLNPTSYAKRDLEKVWGRGKITSDSWRKDPPGSTRKSTSMSKRVGVYNAINRCIAKAVMERESNGQSLIEAEAAGEKAAVAEMQAVLNGVSAEESKGFKVGGKQAMVWLCKHYKEKDDPDGTKRKRAEQANATRRKTKHEQSEESKKEEG